MISMAADHTTAKILYLDVLGVFSADIASATGVPCAAVNAVQASPLYVAMRSRVLDKLWEFIVAPERSFTIETTHAITGRSIDDVAAECAQREAIAAAFAD